MPYIWSSKIYAINTLQAVAPLAYILGMSYIHLVAEHSEQTRGSMKTCSMPIYAQIGRDSTKMPNGGRKTGDIFRLQ